jgi:hypothetical protein
MAAPTVRRWIACAFGASVLLAVAAAAPSAAVAAPTTPSTAFQLTVGVPYTSTIDRSKAATEWLKLPAYMRPGDSLTFTSDSSYSSIRYCLVPSIDDFEQKDTERACDGPGYTSAFAHEDVTQGKFRRTLEWSEQAGPGLLLVAPGCGFCGHDIWTYSVTIEQVITRVNIGTPTLERSSRSISLTAAATFGDNTPASDGIPGHLLWRTGDEGQFQSVGQATTADGRLVFNGTLPPQAAGRTVQISACVDQVGGGEPRCTAQNVKIAPDPIPTLAATQLKMNKRRVVKAPLACSPVFAPTGCQGSIELKTQKQVRFHGSTRKVTLAHQAFVIAAGQTSEVKVRLGKAYAKLVRTQPRAHSVKAIIKLSGQPGKVVRTLRLTR